MALTKVTSSVLDQYAVFPSGTVMLFQQTSAPTGWTKQTTHNDKALRVVSGSVSSGGSVAFSTAFASQAVSGTVGSTTLSTTQMPSHSHVTWVRSSDVNDVGSQGYPANDVHNAHRTTDRGRDRSYTLMDSTGSSGSHNHSFTGTAINMAVNYVDVIFATKD